MASKSSKSYDDDRERQAGGSDNCLLGLCEVRDDSIGYNEEDEVVRRIVLVDMSELGDVSYNGSKVGWSVQLDVVKAVVVSCHHSIYPSTVGIPIVQCQEELMGNLPVRRNSGAKPECRVHLITVVVLDDASHRLYGGLVLIRTSTRVDVVQRGRI